METEDVWKEIAKENPTARDYSGRGMYGKVCFGVEGYSEREVILTLVRDAYNICEEEGLFKEFLDELEGGEVIQWERGL